MKDYLVIASFKHWDGYYHIHKTVTSNNPPTSEAFKDQVLKEVYKLTIGDEFFEDRDWEEESSPDIVFYEIVGKKQLLAKSDDQFINIANRHQEEKIKMAKAHQKKLLEKRERKEYKRLKEQFEGEV